MPLVSPPQSFGDGRFRVTLLVTKQSYVRANLLFVGHRALSIGSLLAEHQSVIIDFAFLLSGGTTFLDSEIFSLAEVNPPILGFQISVQKPRFLT